MSNTEVSTEPLPSNEAIMDRHIQECARRVYDKYLTEPKGFHPHNFAEELSSEIKNTMNGHLATLYGIRKQTICDPRSICVNAELELATRKILLEVRWASPDPRTLVAFAL